MKTIDWITTGYWSGKWKIYIHLIDNQMQNNTSENSDDLILNVSYDTNFFQMKMIDQ